MQHTESALVSYASDTFPLPHANGEVPQGFADASAPSLTVLAVAVTELFKAVHSALRGDLDSAESAMRCAADTLRHDGSSTEIMAESIAPETGDVAEPRGLAPWQIRKIRTHIAANLTDAITTQHLATMARLSPFHFSRAFRNSFGDSPHHYVLRLRIERSQGLMLTTQSTLADIALDCGLVDQAHFGKLFRRFVGESPAKWRRARMNV
jgi:AraC family transcriptional regulator